MGSEVWGSILTCLAPAEGLFENSHLWLLAKSMSPGGSICPTLGTDAPTLGTDAPGLWVEPCKDPAATVMGWCGLRREGCWEGHTFKFPILPLSL